ncbi:MAG TPA: DUF1501 domain-containing protein [Pirellulales bacterium]|nr:DUF1501 domain-containing protein [Pirellulales bacterium]
MSIEVTRNTIGRRHLLRLAGTGFGALALDALLASESLAARSGSSAGEARRLNPLAVLPGHHPARAKSCIFLYLPGGPSQLDLFDYKPKLQASNGTPLPFEKPKLERTKTGNLFASPWKFTPRGQSGLLVSELLPQLAGCVDDLCVIRSMVADNINHTGAALQMNTGDERFPRPSLGSWVTYGLGSENDNLPGFVVISPQSVFQGSPLWGSSFLPGAYQATWVRDLEHPIEHLADPHKDPARQRAQLDALRRLNQLHRRGREIDAQLEARIASFELAFRMQAQAPEAFDHSRETEATKRLYGVGQEKTDVFARQCLLARRLVERGVRFVQVYDSGGPAWDHHSNIKQALPERCAATDQPTAALLCDLKSRGLLDETLVVWGGEFGRSPTAEGADGREHHPFGFAMWLAGGGVRGGSAHGATDEYGWHAVENKVHVHDLHATILHLMGLDHERLTYRWGGRDYRLTDVAGNVVREILV